VSHPRVRGHHHILRISEGERHWGIAAGITAAEIAAYVGAAVAVVGAGVGAYVQIQQSQQQADLAKAVQRQKEAEAQAATETAQFEETQHRRRITLLMGQQEATYAASGLDPSQGTPMIREIDLAKQGELEALSIRRGGAIEAASSRFEANIAKFQAGVYANRMPYQIAGGVLQASAAGLSAYSTARGRQTKKPSVLSDDLV
jgi:hypothetical protein